MSKENDSNKDRLLGMPHGTANAMLRKSLIFKLAGLANMLTCHQCTKVIERVEDLSIEHKHPWQKAQDPKASFFDLDNIAFSHLRCNIGAATRPNKIVAPPGQRWCKHCKAFKPEAEFSASAANPNRCRVCHKSVNQRWRADK
jgi:hypothetical protein